MLPAEGLCRLVHALCVQGTEGPAYLTTLNARANRAVIDHVAVTAVGGGKTGVEIAHGIARPVHGNIVRQRGIDAHDPGSQVAHCRGIKMHHLVTGMDAGVRSARTDQVHGLIRHPRDCPRELRLDRTNPGLLQLPAMKRSAVILQREHNPAVADGIICGKRLRAKEQVTIRLAVETKRRLLPGISREPAL